VDEPGIELGSAQQEAGNCPVCGTKLAIADSDFCPVCILRGAAEGESAATGGPGSEFGLAVGTQEVDDGVQVQRFENYELMLDGDGRPIELGRGAMGVTYKALDVDLRCPVTLKIISERYLGDELAKLRFLREARAAASVHHSNVASVYFVSSPSVFMPLFAWQKLDTFSAFSCESVRVAPQSGETRRTTSIAWKAACLLDSLGISTGEGGIRTRGTPFRGTTL
jgi:hypothetical protein